MEWEQYMQINAKTKDVVWNSLGIFFSLGSQVIWLPVLIHYLPPDILGLWYVFVSIGGPCGTHGQRLYADVEPLHDVCPDGHR